jgi:hypothetical protein
MVAESDKERVQAPILGKRLQTGNDMAVATVDTVKEAYRGSVSHLFVSHNATYCFSNGYYY